MRFLFVLLMALMLSGCSAYVMSGGSAGSGRAASVATADAQIVSRIEASFRADDRVSGNAIRVSSWNATVTLSGSVDDIVARERAESLARNTSGVKAVNNQIVIED